MLATEMRKEEEIEEVKLRKEELELFLLAGLLGKPQGTSKDTETRASAKLQQNKSSKSAVFQCGYNETRSNNRNGNSK